MVFQAKAKCPNGHLVEFGPCNSRNTIFLLFHSTCTSTDHEVLSAAEIRCRRCNTVHHLRICPICNSAIPVTAFRQRSITERLKGAFRRPFLPVHPRPCLLNDRHR